MTLANPDVEELRSDAAARGRARYWGIEVLGGAIQASVRT